MYDYKVIDANGVTSAVKRAVIYLAFLIMVVSFALIVLYILFERYLFLVIPGCGIFFSAFIVFFMGRKNDLFRYSFDERGRLTISTRQGKSFVFDVESFVRIKQAEYSDFRKKEIEKYCFPQSSLFANGAGKAASAQKILFSYKGKEVILLLDEYAENIMTRSEK